MFSLPFKMKALSILAKNSWKIEIELFQMNTRVRLKYFVHDRLWKKFLFLTCPRLFELYFLTILVALRPLTQFSSNLRAHNFQKMWKVALLDNCFSGLLTAVQPCFWKFFKFDSDCSLRMIKWTPAKIWLFLTIVPVNEDIKTKINFTDNLAHNILRLFDVWTVLLST